MELPSATTEQHCPRAEISAYIDGELNPAEELALESHVAMCRECLSELNFQKQILTALDFSLNEKNEIRLPENFARVVAVRAESGVSGLRSKTERLRALFLCASLFLIVVLGISRENGTFSAIFSKLWEQVFAVAYFALHLVFDISLGAAVILRSLSGQFVFNSMLSVLFAASLFALAAAALSRMLFHSSRS